MQLRWYQQEACDSAFSHLCSLSGNPIICLPTGAGKSIVIAEIARRSVEQYNGRVLIVQHRKELIEQNRDKVQQFLPIKVGSYSAGLRKYETDEPVVLGGIQSIYDKAAIFGHRNLLIIDEAHLVGTKDESMFKSFIKDCQTINPRLRVIGLTATPFRTGEGSICSAGGVFQKVCYDAPITRLIDEGFLCRLTNKPTQSEFDTSGLHKRMGEFIQSEMEKLFGDLAATTEACKEIVSKSTGRNSCLIFCSGVSHAMNVVEILSSLTGERIGLITGESMDIERAAILSDFKNQSLRWLVNVDVLTTGFDAPCIDLIALLRATLSPGLYAQMVGRGFRIHPAKLDTLVLDFGQNIKRHGPVDALEFGKPKGKTRESQEGPHKQCPNCEEDISAAKLICECGFKFPDREPNNGDEADTESQILSEPESFDVLRVGYAVHRKKGTADAIPTLRVDYLCVRSEGNIEETISEWVCIEHEGFARKKAEAWWKLHSLYDFPPDTETAVDWSRLGCCACPKSLVARREGKWWRIISKEIEELPVVGEEVQEEELPF